MKSLSKKIFIAALAGLAVTAALAQTNTATLAVKLAQAGKPISPDLFGIFFEDLNWAADGGLYAELAQNRSFEYSTAERMEWNNFTAWEFTQRGGGKGSVAIETAHWIHPNNPHYAVLEVAQPGDGVGLVNTGFDGIAVQAGAQYDFSVFARQLFTGARWGADKVMKSPAKILVRLESADRETLGETVLDISGRDWQRVSGIINATNSDANARLVVLSLTRGGMALDEISLFPHITFHNRANGLRADLAQAIADLHPKFMRFPGGCLVHGHGLDNLYRWKDSIGPVEQRQGQANLWGYHQSLGLGYFEFFQFCEDIGAKPLPVVPAGVCCQNADHQGGTGQRGLPLEAMPAYIQDVLDLIEYANGPTNSTWGAKRAAAGHPAPFNLQYLGVGNEEHITPVFEERFKMIFDALKRAHPEITVIGTVGPFHSGEDFNAGWKIADALNVPMVDEHYYEEPAWFLNNLTRYDHYDRTKSKVYLGEYASKGNNLYNALAEAAYLTALERNGDVVHMASYAPLLCRQNHSQWRPDMIYFDATRLTRSANYFVQQLFSQNQGDVWLTNTLAGNPNLSVSTVRDSRSGDVILKLVNLAAPQTLHLALDGLPPNATATKTVFTGDRKASNAFGKPEILVPQSSPVTAGPEFDCEVPENSLMVLRIKTR